MTLINPSFEDNIQLFDGQFSENSNTIVGSMAENNITMSNAFAETNHNIASSFGEVYEIDRPVNDTDFVTEDDVVEMLNDLKAAKIGWVTLLASAWIGDGNLYRQVVEIEGVTKNSQVDLTPNVEQLVIFYEKDLSFVAENDNGTVTVYAIGQKPMNDYTIQVTVTEVDV